MLVGSLVVSRLKSVLATWSALIFLLSIHLWTNYRAVRAVSIRTLNRQRANLIFSSYFRCLKDEGPYPGLSKQWHRLRRSKEKCGLPSPKEVSLKEQIFELDGVMRWHGKSVMGHCILGVPLNDILDSLPLSTRHPLTGSYSSIRSGGKNNIATKEHNSDISVEVLLEVFEEEDYILWCSLNQSQTQKHQRPHFLIVLKETSDAVTQAKSWFHAFLCARKLHTAPELSQQKAIEILKASLEEVRDFWPEVLESLKKAGWDVETGALETRSGVRVKVSVEPGFEME